MTAQPEAQSAEGWIWFSAGTNLVRFDGQTFRGWGIAEGWRGGRILAFAQTNSGENLVGGAWGLFQFHPEAPRAAAFSSVPLPAPCSEVTRIFEDRQARVWVACLEGVRVRDKGVWRAFAGIARGRPHHHSRATNFAEDAGGGVWIATYSGLHYLARDGQIERYGEGDATPVDDSVLCVMVSPDGKIWAGGEEGIFRLTRPGVGVRARVDRIWRKADGLPSEYVHSLARWKGAVMASTLGGLVRIDGEDRVAAYPEMGGFREPSLERLLVDRRGTLWIGSDGSGVMAAADAGFTTFGANDGLGFPRIQQILEDRDGRLVAVGQSDSALVLNVFDGRGRFQAVRPSFGEGVRFAWTWWQIVLQDGAGAWWFATTRGAARFPGAPLDRLASAQPEFLPALLPGRRGYVTRLFEDSRRGLWVAAAGLSASALFHRAPGATSWRRFTEADGWSTFYDNGATGFAEDRAGNIWIGRMENGLFRYRGGRLESVGAGTTGVRAGPRWPHVDAAGRLWVASKEGLLRIDQPDTERPALRIYSEADGLSDSSLTCITSSLQGVIYVCTPRGVDEFDPATGRVRSYTARDGLLPGALISAYRDRAGALWFGGAEGLSRFVPRADAAAPPALFIQAVRAGSRDIRISAHGAHAVGGIALAPGDQRLQVEYASADERVLYQYRLAGLNDWTEPRPARGVSLEGLAPGDYTFEVRAVQADGRTGAPAVVRFGVTPPLWRRWWFLAAVAAALGALAWAFHRYRVRRILELESVRLRIAADLHDDIGSTLSQVSLLGELARRSLRGGNEEAAAIIARMAETSRGAVTAMGDIVWSIHPKHDRLGDLVQRMRHFGTETLDAAAIDFEFTTPPPDTLDEVLALDARRELFLIFKELIHNAARHSHGRRVHATLEADGSHLLLVVEDDGTGLVENAAEKGHGLASIRTRAQRLKGDARWEPAAPGAGTRAVVRINVGAFSYANR